MKDAMQKLVLNDAGVTVHPESSSALGSGYRCGFLGLLHMEVFMQRMEQEFAINVLATAPSVPYKRTCCCPLADSIAHADPLDNSGDERRYDEGR